MNKAEAWAILIATALTTLWLAGCSLIPMKRQEQEGIQASQQIATEHELTLRRVTEPVVQPPGLPGKSNAGVREDLTVTDKAHAGSESHEQAHSWYKQSFPLWVSLIGMAVGVGLLIFVFKWARRSSPAIDAAFRVGEQAAESAANELSGVIRNLRTHAVTATDPSQQALLQTHISELEAARGRTEALKFQIRQKTK